MVSRILYCFCKVCYSYCRCCRYSSISSSCSHSTAQKSPSFYPSFWSICPFISILSSYWFIFYELLFPFLSLASSALYVHFSHLLLVSYLLRYWNLLLLVSSPYHDNLNLYYHLLRFYSCPFSLFYCLCNYYGLLFTPYPCQKYPPFHHYQASLFFISRLSAPRRDFQHGNLCIVGDHYGHDGDEDSH